MNGNRLLASNWRSRIRDGERSDEWDLKNEKSENEKTSERLDDEEAAPHEVCVCVCVYV